MKAEGRPGANRSDYERKKEAFRQRTKEYAARVIRLYCAMPPSRVELQVLGRQLLRAGTSVAANFREASRARSSAGFASKCDLCAQEADESMLWLELLRDECGLSTEDLDWLLRESDELIAIFVAMSKKVKKQGSSLP